MKSGDRYVVGDGESSAFRCRLSINLGDLGKTTFVFACNCTADLDRS